MCERPWKAIHPATAIGNSSASDRLFVATEPWQRPLKRTLKAGDNMRRFRQDRVVRNALKAWAGHFPPSVQAVGPRHDGLTVRSACFQKAPPPPTRAFGETL